MWKTMASAPKDGTAILLIASAKIDGGDPTTVVGHWTEDEWRTKPIPNGLGWEPFDLVPHYWMPILVFPRK